MVTHSYDINTALAEISDRFTIKNGVIRPARKGTSPTSTELEAIDYLVCEHDYSYVSSC